jgi:hypothetical protein
MAAAVVLTTLAVGGSTVWLATVTGGDSRPAQVEIVPDGRWGGPDVFEHGRPAPQESEPQGSLEGSADTWNHRTFP